MLFRSSAPGQKVQEVVFADRFGAGRCIRRGLAILNATVDVMHCVPRVMGLSMPVGSLDFQGPRARGSCGSYGPVFCHTWKDCVMRSLVLLVLSILLSIGPIGCTSASREGLPPGSPFLDAGVMKPEVLPQGIAVGDVSSQGALLWVRTEGPASVQVEWAPLSVWQSASKMASTVAPVVRTARVTTGPETDFTVTIPLEGAVPATRYRYHVLVGQIGRAHV